MRRFDCLKNALDMRDLASQSIPLTRNRYHLQGLLDLILHGIIYPLQTEFNANRFRWQPKPNQIHAHLVENPSGRRCNSPQSSPPRTSQTSLENSNSTFKTTHSPPASAPTELEPPNTCRLFWGGDRSATSRTDPKPVRLEIPAERV